MTLRKKICAGIKIHLKENKITQTELAKMTGMTQPYLNAMLCGKKDISNQTTKLTNALGVTEWEIIKLGHESGTYSTEEKKA